MLNITEADGEVVPTCIDEPLCLSTELQLAAITVNFASFMINIFHLVMLGNITRRSHRTSSFITSMKAIVGNDIAYSLSSILVLSCNIREITQRSHPLSHLLSPQSSAVTTIRYVFLATSMAERLISLYLVRFNKALKHVHWLFLGEAALLIISMFVKDFLQSYGVCYVTSKGAVNYHSQIARWVMGAPLATSITVIVISIPILQYQVHQLNKCAITNKQRSITAETRYVVITGAIFLVLPILLFLRVNVLTPYHSATWFQPLILLSQASYGIINTVIYGFMSKVYRRTLGKVLRIA